MRLSIITPSFRQVPFLRLCAKSVADQQGNFTLEHLVQDGGSGDEFFAWAGDQTFADAVIEKDQGMYDAINKGFLRSTGDVLAWLNCDEQYLPGALEKVSNWFAAYPDRDVLFGDIVLIDESGQPLSYRKAINPLRSHIKNCFLPTFSAATFVRRSVVTKGFLLDTRFRTISDAVWIDALLGAGFRTGILNEPLATFMQTGQNLGQSNTSIAESELWRKECGAGRLGEKTFWATHHRLRKAFQGAYSRKKVSISIHHPNFAERVRSEAIVGGRWKTKP